MSDDYSGKWPDYAPLSIISSKSPRVLRGRNQFIRDTTVVGAKVIGLIQCITGDSYAVTLGLHFEASQDDTLVISGQGAPVVAFLEWGTEGGQNSAEIDILQGTSLSLGCSYLKVSARVDTQQRLSAPQSRTVSSSVFLGGVSTSLPPQRSELILGLGVGVTIDIFLPKYAHNIRVCRTPFTSAYRIEQRSIGGFLLCQTDVLTLTDLPAPIPITQVTRIIRIENIGAVIIDSMSVIFGLNL